MGRRIVAVIAAAFSLAAPAAAQEPRHLDPSFLASIDDAQLHATITPPGSDTRHATTELGPYDSLVQGYPKLTEDEIRTRYFKDRRFGPVADVQRTYSPRAGVTVVRDAKWGEPKILGATDADMAFGAGFVAAEDRLPIMELLRALGRGEAFELIGTVPAWLADAELARVYGYTEEEFQAQIDRLPAVYGQNGADIKAILEAYVAGINEYLAAAARGEVPLPSALADAGITSPAPWRPTDVVAVVSIVRALFGAGGGSELNNAAVLAGLQRDFGAEGGRSVFEDFRNRDNADGPVHTTKRFPYMQRDAARLDPRANARGFEPGDSGLGALAEAARVKTERLKLSTPLGAIDLSRPGAMSNHFVIGRGRSATGHPLLLGGPQAGYFSPQIVMDYELHSPTIHARGVGFPGLSTLVVMGRTQDYAWTPTAGGGDMIDTYVDKLCEPGGGPPTEQSRHYEFRGACVAMDRRTVRGAPPELTGQVPDIIVERTVHGPVMARGRIGGVPVAVTSKRSTYMRELDPAVSILRMNRNEATTGERFVDIFHESHNLSTNWSYANDDEIAYVHGGLYPRRPAAVDPDLPVWGTGEWEWGDTFLGRDEVPNEVAPKRDFFVSWNNSQAPGWGASDAQWGHSSIHRGKLLEDAILAETPGTIDPVRLVQMMEHAGLTDLRGRYVAPVALRVLERAENVGPRERRMIELLRAWVAEGALRRDGDANGDYDHSAAVAIMDAWWERLIRAMYDPVLGDAARIPLGFDNAPGSGGSAYEAGWYGQLRTDLSMVLGDRVRSPTSRIYCGGSREASGTLPECAKRVLASLAAAGDAMEGDDPNAWRADAEGERIRFLPGAALSMHWVNRPTTQQLAMFGAHAEAAAVRGAPACAASSAFRGAVRARPRGRGVAFTLRRRGSAPATVDVVRVANGRRLRRFAGRRASFAWSGRGARNGHYVVRFRSRAPDGTDDVRRIPLRRLRGRFRPAPAIERVTACGAIRRFALVRPAFGPRNPLRVSIALASRRPATLELRRGRRVVRRVRFTASERVVRLRPRGLRAGAYRLVLRAGRATATLGARKRSG